MKRSDLLAIWETLFPPANPEKQAAWNKRFAQEPPEWWHVKRQKPEAEPPKQAKKPTENAREISLDEWSEAEIEQMTEAEFRAITWKTGEASKEKFIQRTFGNSANESRKAQRQIDFDAEIESQLTRRECGELKAYTPELKDFELAAKVKTMKAQGLKLREIAERTRHDYQLIKHYSSALKKAAE